MHSYQIEVKRTDQFKIEIDELIWNKEALANWSSVFFPVESTEFIAEHLAKSIVHSGVGSFFEGYGYVKAYREDMSEVTQGKFIENDYIKIPEEEYAKGIKIIIIEEENYECDTTNLTN